MGNNLAQLPRGFEDLAPFVPEWGQLCTQDERYRRRQDLPMDRLVAYYEAVHPRLSAIFDHLDRFPFPGPLPEPEALLLRVAMAMSEVAQAVEMYGCQAVPNAPVDHSMRITGLSCA